MSPASPELTAGALLTIDLDALQRNYRLFQREAPKAAVAAVVKADAYGLGIGPVARALAAAGCTSFFVALIDEGIALRRVLPQAEIFVLDGLFPDTETFFAEHGLIPVLNDLEQIRQWAAFCRKSGRALPTAIHFDTGINRLGLDAAQAAELKQSPELMGAFTPRLLISHLACADEPQRAMSARQLERFGAIMTDFPGIPGCLANSAGVFLGPDYQFDMVRPGVGLYGGTMFVDRPNPMEPVVTLEGRIMQRRRVRAGESVGYGATYTAPSDREVAVVSVGYGDGFSRALSQVGSAYAGGKRVPVIGRVSMDMITIDVTEVAADLAKSGQFVELLGRHITVDDVARAIGTISYEVLTSLGQRYARRYIGGAA